MPSETIIVADDHPVFRDALCALIKHLVPGAQLLPADTFSGAVALARELPAGPSMMILDLCFTRQNIKLELPALRREFNRSAIVVVTMTEDQATVDAVMDYGINGYIGKAVPPADMIEALRAIREGDLVVNVPAAEVITAGGGLALSDRQMKVLRHIAAGRTNKEIAQALDISPFTVRIHVSALFRALGVNNRSAAVTKAMAEGLLAP